MFYLISLRISADWLSLLIKISMALGSGILLFLILLLMVELRQDKRINRYYEHHRKRKLQIANTVYECQALPRDRKGEFEPELVKKQQTSLSGDIEEMILSMYLKGMSTSDIEWHIRDIYGLEISDSAISRITDKILPVVREWQAQPLASVYAVVYLRSCGRQIVKKAVYTAIGLDMDGRRDVLGMYIGENESAKFWLTVLNNLKNRGVVTS